jgi:hypothetical protein
MLFTIKSIKWIRIKLKRICIHKKIGYCKYDITMTSWTKIVLRRKFKVGLEANVKANGSFPLAHNEVLYPPFL